MDDVLNIINVAVLFFLRIGVPVLALIVLGTIIDRWQARREAWIAKHFTMPSKH